MIATSPSSKMTHATEIRTVIRSLTTRQVNAMLAKPFTEAALPRLTHAIVVQSVFNELPPTATPQSVEAHIKAKRLRRIKG